LGPLDPPAFADYTAQFHDFVEEEGLLIDDDRTEFLLPIIKNLWMQPSRASEPTDEAPGQRHTLERHRPKRPSSTL
jgi:hypothetical protein